jgi:hypothetical protein
MVLLLGPLKDFHTSMVLLLGLTVACYEAGADPVLT